MEARLKRSVVVEAWRLAKPYWSSEEKWSAWGLLLAVVELAVFAERTSAAGALAS
jgi:ABC-type uncharacterized transport system fused permease/ATPase subunit